MHFSILICTYNGASRLPETLNHLARLQFSQGISAEVLVVNNACTDDSEAVVHTTWDALGNPYALRLLLMPNPGKSHALELGIRKATGDYIVICDDDNWLNPDYLIVAKQYVSMYPNASILAGQALAVADGPIPDWFSEKQWAYACGPQKVAAGNTTGRKLLWSAGMILQHKLAEVIFNGPVPMLLLGRTGKQLVSGEDDEICLRAWLLGAQTHYVPDLIFRHYMAPHRLTLEYRDALIAGFSYQTDAIGAYWRLYTLINSGGAFFVKIIKKWLAWQVYRLNGKTREGAHAADTLYFLTRAKRWITPENRAVYQFYVKSKKIINN